jgi:hypothetical protein
MSPVLLAQLISTLGTVGLPLIARLIEEVKAGKTQTTVTAEDLLELHRLSNLKAADIFAKQGAPLPPAA